ncbi:MAG: HEXXH motif-containing putative peptide modification protein [Paracoccaceae bacterium]|nr:HEXXH motif-containing putative peptide modification protein [Paracoccaceae bacterium]
MLGLYDEAQCVARLENEVGAPFDESFYSAYHAWLAAIQPQVTLPRRAAPEFVTDEADERALLNLFLYEDERDAKTPVNGVSVAQMFEERDPEDVARNIARARTAYETLADYSPARRRLFDAVVTRIISTGLRGVSGGSANSCIGVLWINPPKKASPDDVVEFIVHELAHTLGYIDETATPHFQSEAFGQVIPAFSAVRCQQRPLYHVMHSLFVGCELLAFRKEQPRLKDLRLHPGTVQLRTSCAASLASVMDLPVERIFTERGLDVVSAIGRFLAREKAAADRTLAAAGVS